MLYIPLIKINRRQIIRLLIGCINLLIFFFIFMIFSVHRTAQLFSTYGCASASEPLAHWFGLNHHSRACQRRKDKMVAMIRTIMTAWSMGTVTSMGRFSVSLVTRIVSGIAVTEEAGTFTEGPVRWMGSVIG